MNIEDTDEQGSSEDTTAREAERGRQGSGRQPSQSRDREIVPETRHKGKEQVASRGQVQELRAEQERISRRNEKPYHNEERARTTTTAGSPLIRADVGLMRKNETDRREEGEVAVWEQSTTEEA